MRLRTSRRPLALGALGILCCLALASSAGSQARRAPSHPSVQLSCTVAAPTNPPHPVVDSLSSELTCSVRGANPADRSFAVHYQLGTLDGATNRFDLVCSAMLRHGTGTCSRPFYVPFPFAPSESWAVGVSLPSGGALGPVIPAPVGPASTE